MRAQAAMSLHPLRTAAPADFIGSFIGRLRCGGLRVKIGPMSSRLSGECEDMFRALGEAFRAAARESDVVATVKVANARPETGGMMPDAREARPAGSSGST